MSINNNDKQDEAKRIILDYILNVSFKPLLEENLFISDMYNDEEISHNSFREILEEFRSKIEGKSSNNNNVCRGHNFVHKARLGRLCINCGIVEEITNE